MKIDLSVKEIWAMVKKQGITQEKWKEFINFFIVKKESKDQSNATPVSSSKV
jgi:hypothetical protein